MIFLLYFVGNEIIFISLRRLINHILNILTVMKTLVEQIQAQYEVFAENATAQVEKGNKAAGTRARKAALEISKLMKDFRKSSVEASK